MKNGRLFRDHHHSLHEMDFHFLLLHFIFDPSQHFSLFLPLKPIRKLKRVDIERKNRLLVVWFWDHFSLFARMELVLRAGIRINGCVNITLRSRINTHFWGKNCFSILNPHLVVTCSSSSNYWWIVFPVAWNKRGTRLWAWSESWRRKKK